MAVYGGVWGSLWKILGGVWTLRGRLLGSLWREDRDREGRRVEANGEGAKRTGSLEDREPRGQGEVGMGEVGMGERRGA